MIINGDNITSNINNRLNVQSNTGFPSGSQSLPPINFNNDTDTGIYNPNSNEIGISTAGIEKARINSVGQQSSVIPDLSGSNTTLYPEYKCRGWVNFNGTGTVAIRASGNVSSITDNGTGSYAINFTDSMPDANYSVVTTSDRSNGGGASLSVNTSTVPTISSVSLINFSDAGSSVDGQFCCIGVFR